MSFTVPPIQFKRSTVAGSKPTPADLNVGEIAINFADKTIYTKNHLNQIISVGGGTGGAGDSDIAIFISNLDLVYRSDFDSDFGISLALRTTDDLQEGSVNSYYYKSNVDSDINQILDVRDFATHSDVDSDIQVAITGVPGLVDVLNDLKASLDSDSDGVGSILTELSKKLDKTTDTTDDLNEGATNLYYIKARVDSDINDFVLGQGVAIKSEVDSDFIIVQTKINKNKQETDSDIALVQAKVLHNKAAIDSDILRLEAAALDSEIKVLSSEFYSLKQVDSDLRVKIDHNKLATDSDFANLNADSIANGLINRFYRRSEADSDTLEVITNANFATQQYVDSEISVAITGTGGVLETIQAIQDALDSDSEVVKSILIQLGNKVDKTTDTTDDLNEGATNLYYTKARVDSDVADYLGGANLGGPDSEWVLNNASAASQIFFTQMVMQGNVSVTTSNLQRWYVPDTIEITKITIQFEKLLGNATLNFNINGNVWLQKTLTSLTTIVSVLPVKEVTAGSYLTIGVPVVGSSTENLSVIIRYRLKV